MTTVTVSDSSSFRKGMVVTVNDQEFEIKKVKQSIIAIGPVPWYKRLFVWLYNLIY